MYECKNCNYTTTKKSDWNKHIITKKHKKLVSGIVKQSEISVAPVIIVKNVKKRSTTNDNKFVCENCGRKYKFRSGLSRHEMRCNVVIQHEETVENEDEQENVFIDNTSINVGNYVDEQQPKISTQEEKDEKQLEYDRIQENKKIEQRLREQLKEELRKEQEMEDKKRHEIEMQKNTDVLNQVYNKLTSDTKALNEAFKTTILETIESQVIKKQQEQISDLQTMLKSSIESNKQTVSEMLPRIGNTTNITQQMTVNIFLNEECKNALNLNEFLRTLDLSVEDLLYTSQNGYSKGIANIFVKKLQDLKPTERPIHCSDKDELHFYIKDQNVWEKDKENMKIDRSIEHITQKQIQKIKEWERGNPTWQHTDKDAKFYMNLIKEAVGGLTETERKENFEKIRKELGINIDIGDFIDDGDKIDNE